MNKILIYALMALGEGLILFTSFIFLKPLEPVNLFALNTVVLSLSYLITFSIFFDLFNVVSIKNKTSSSRAGALICGTILYFLFSVCLIICSYVYKWELLIAVWSQCAALSPLFLSIVISSMSGSAVSAAMQKHEDCKMSLQNISNCLNTLELKLKCNPKKIQRITQIENIKEKLRYITHSNNQQAKDVETRILDTIIEMTGLVNSTIQDDRDWNIAVERCFTLIELRKQQL